jgi:hypothetical protein
MFQAYAVKPGKGRGVQPQPFPAHGPYLHPQTCTCTLCPLLLLGTEEEGEEESAKVQAQRWAQEKV